jgi:rod shape-determining protein MreC
MKLGTSDKTIFVQGPYLAYRLMLAVVLSMALIFIDVRYKHLDTLRSTIGLGLTPVHWLSDLPINVSTGLSNLFTSREDLQETLELHQSRMLVLERKAQKLASVTAELNRLRELLNASRLVDEGVVVTEMIGASPDPDNQYIMINKGAQDGVYLGQAVLDSQGLMGQVIEVNEFSSRTLLISDNRHAVPVQVNRNGVRAIAYGIGALDYLELGNVPDTADINVGDLLVSSGLGGRFPAGYPVARVSSINHDAGRSFAQIRVIPEAKLNRSRLLLLVFKAKDALSSNKPNSSYSNSSVGQNPSETQ